MTDPATETKSIGLLAAAQLSWFLQRHLDNFILTGQFAAVYQDSANWTTLSRHGNPAHLPCPDSYREAKNSAPRPFASLMAGSDGDSL